MTTHDIRKKYLDFFEKNGHAIVPSSSLLPENDPTTLFTGSGMQSMVPYLLGEKHPLGKRLADSQKCFRAQDIEEVGDNRHTTFFEMLGNWSLGDYFKHEQIPWVFEFVTKELELDPNNLYVTCFRGNPNLNIPKDEESAVLWQDLFQEAGIDAKILDNAEANGMQGGRIFYYDETKNWWSRSGVPVNMPVGEPGGPDSEIFWDFGVDLGLHEQSEWKDVPCHVNCDCGRFIEIGNNVFMQYKKTGSGFEELPQKNVDFGGGLERMAAALNGNPDIFMIDIFENARKTLEQISKKTYGGESEETKAFRVILDHLRAATFLVADGAIPSNKDQGYFTRRLIRRAVRYGQTLGISDAFCAGVAGAVVEVYAGVYPELLQKKDMILEALSAEEKKFKRTIEKGIRKFEELESRIKNQESRNITAEDAFDLYQSFGFPIELTEELAEEKGLSVDREGFEQEKEKHAALSRKGAEKKFKGGLADHSDMSVKYHTATHLLHAAVRKVLGEDTVQKGSNITPERLRFDFAYPNKLTPEQKQEIEDLVNAAIEHDYPVSFVMMSVDEARKKGAIGLFEDNYGDQVKVYTVGDPNEPAAADPSAPAFSREFCGGPHVGRTGVLGHFKIKKEESVGSGVRRIKAILE